METCYIEGEYIQLNQLLKKLDWAGSGGEARVYIEQGLVTVNGQTASEIRKKLRDGDVVEMKGRKAVTVRQAAAEQ